jgi:hypothetical protein
VAELLTFLFIYSQSNRLHVEWQSLTSSGSQSNIIVVDPKAISLRNGVPVNAGDNERVTITTKIVNGKLQKTITRGGTKMVIHGTNEDVLNRYIEHALLKQSQPQATTTSSTTHSGTANIITTKTATGNTVTQRVISYGSLDKVANTGAAITFSSAAASTTTQQSTLFKEPTMPEIPPCHYDNLVIAGIDPNQDIPRSFPSRDLILGKVDACYASSLCTDFIYILLSLPFSLSLTDFSLLYPGIAANIDIRNFAIFCGSLRNARINATTILFMNERIPKEHSEVAAKFNVLLLVYNRQQLEPSFIRIYHPSSLRWILFDWFFSIRNGSYQHHFDRVLALDVRDSAFQTDPFELFHFQQLSSQGLIPLNVSMSRHEDHDKMFVFGENRFIAISSCAWNSGWIRDCFGERIYNLVKDQPISCSGISMGGITRMVNYVNKMSQVLLNNFPCINGGNAKYFPTCERNGVDQGVHNVLLHLQYLSPLLVKYSDDFPVVNLQSSPELMLEKSTTFTQSIGTNKAPPREPAIYMVKYPGVKYAVVHQYDRDSVYQLLLGKKYLPSIDWDSPIADWAQTEACTANFGVVFGADFLRGKCDSGASRGMTPAACCSACMNQRKSMIEKNITTKACTAFTFLDGVCYLKHCPEKEVKLLVDFISDPNFKDVTMTNLKAVSGYFKSSPM